MGLRLRWIESPRSPSGVTLSKSLAPSGSHFDCPGWTVPATRTGRRHGAVSPRYRPQPIRGFVREGPRRSVRDTRPGSAGAE